MIPDLEAQENIVINPQGLKQAILTTQKRKSSSHRLVNAADFMKCAKPLVSVSIESHLNQFFFNSISYLYYAKTVEFEAWIGGAV